MASDDFARRYRDPRWQRRRLEIMQRAGFACEHCGATEKTLNVHHKIYRRAAAPWEYADADLACLCEECHEAEHHVRLRLAEALVHLDPHEIEQMLGFAEARAAVAHVFSGEEPDKARRWILTSYEHAWGFLVGLRARSAPQEIERLIDSQPLDFSIVFSIGTGAWGV